jgi:hypothetical protein
MQDKSALPEVLQKRKGNFGKRGQSKYTHLTAEDTTDTNPLTRADESLLNSWKKKMAGYKKWWCPIAANFIDPYSYELIFSAYIIDDRNLYKNVFIDRINLQW